MIDGVPDEAAFTALRRSELIGRPLGSPAFLAAVGRQLGRVMTPAKRGRKPKAGGDKIRKKINEGAPHHRNS